MFCRQKAAYEMIISGWSSDVCSSDLWAAGARLPGGAELDRLRLLAATAGLAFDRQLTELRGRVLRADLDNRIRTLLARSEERSVGTEGVSTCRFRRSPYHEQQNLCPQQQIGGSYDLSYTVLNL